MQIQIGGLADEQQEPNVCTVRLKTATWSDSKGLHTKKSLTFLRRQCAGYNLLEEDAGAIGADEVVTRIINLDSCKDGVYEVVACNESRDFESGYIDNYDYKLVPLAEPQKEGLTAVEPEAPEMRP